MQGVAYVIQLLETQDECVPAEFVSSGQKKIQTILDFVYIQNILTFEIHSVS